MLDSQKNFTPCRVCRTLCINNPSSQELGIIHLSCVLTPKFMIRTFSAEIVSLRYLTSRIIVCHFTQNYFTTIYRGLQVFFLVFFEKSRFFEISLKLNNKPAWFRGVCVYFNKTSALKQLSEHKWGYYSVIKRACCHKGINNQHSGQYGKHSPCTHISPFPSARSKIHTHHRCKSIHGECYCRRWQYGKKHISYPCA